MGNRKLRRQRMHADRRHGDTGAPRAGGHSRGGPDFRRAIVDQNLLAGVSLIDRAGERDGPLTGCGRDGQNGDGGGDAGEAVRVAGAVKIPADNFAVVGDAGDLGARGAGVRIVDGRQLAAGRCDKAVRVVGAVEVVADDLAAVVDAEHERIRRAIDVERGVSAGRAVKAETMIDFVGRLIITDDLAAVVDAFGDGVDTVGWVERNIFASYAVAFELAQQSVFLARAVVIEADDVLVVVDAERMGSIVAGRGVGERADAARPAVGRDEARGREPVVLAVARDAETLLRIPADGLAFVVNSHDAGLHRRRVVRAYRIVDCEVFAHAGGDGAEEAMLVRDL